MSKTSILPPLTAVRLVWARTAKFSNEAESSAYVQVIENRMQRMLDELKTSTDPNAKKEQSYLNSAFASMDASMRSLETVYKGRTLNFSENQQLRAVHLENIQDSLQFGTKLKDAVKSLPTMSITTAIGVVTADQVFHFEPGILWAIGIASAAIGFFFQWIVVRAQRERKQMYYIRQDYERNMYYLQYTARVTNILYGLLLELERLHYMVFGENYYGSSTPELGVIEEILKGVYPDFCPCIHKHIQQGVIKPELWTLCETGISSAYKSCPMWEENCKG